MWPITSYIAIIVSVIVIGWIVLAAFFGLKALWKQSRELVITLVVCAIIVTIIYFVIKSVIK